MRTYTVHYLAEENDECVDKEEDITCHDVNFVLPEFYKLRIMHKRVTGILEKPLKKVQHHENTIFQQKKTA